MIIGITGGIASGKTYICNYLKSKNYSIFESDKEISNLSKREEIIVKIKQEFLELGDGEIKKEVLKEICLNDYKKLYALQQIYLPLLEIEINKFLSLHKDEEFVFLEGPLLFEVGYDKFVEKMITIVADINIREERAINRGVSRSNFKKFVEVQMSDDEKLKQTDYVIYSNNVINNVEVQIINLINSFKNERNSSRY